MAKKRVLIISVKAGAGHIRAAEAVRKAFMNLAKDPKGLEIIQRIYNHEGYAPAQDSDYNEVRTYLERKDQWSF